MLLLCSRTQDMERIRKIKENVSCSQIPIGFPSPLRPTEGKFPNRKKRFFTCNCLDICKIKFAPAAISITKSRDSNTCIEKFSSPIPLQISTVFLKYSIELRRRKAVSWRFSHPLTSNPLISSQVGPIVDNYKHHNPRVTRALTRIFF